MIHGTMATNSGDATRYEKKCPICKKVFFMTGSWVYKLRGTKGEERYYCSWTCYREAEKRNDDKRKYGTLRGANYRKHRKPKA